MGDAAAFEYLVARDRPERSASGSCYLYSLEMPSDIVGLIHTGGPHAELTTPLGTNLLKSKGLLLAL